MSERMDIDRFESLVEDALAGLPRMFAEALSNLELVIEDDSEDPDLLGLYEGVPLTERGNDYSGFLPDRITIYQLPIEQMATSDDHLKEIVRDTVLHEIAHHFGIDDDRLHELGRD